MEVMLVFGDAEICDRINEGGHQDMKLFGTSRFMQNSASEYMHQFKDLSRIGFHIMQKDSAFGEMTPIMRKMLEKVYEYLPEEVRKDLLK